MEIKNLAGAVIYKSDKVLNIKDLVQEALKADVDLSGANLAAADLQGLKSANSAAQFKGANFSRAMLSVCNLPSADFSGANLTQVTFFGAKLPKASFVGANMVGAVLIKADLTSANLSGADLSGADLTLTVLTGANLDGVKK